MRAFTLTVAPGEIVALTGPSGVGKSSVLGALLGYVPHTGRVTLDGEPFRGIPDVAWMGQQPQLNPGTVGDNIRLGDEDADPALAVAAAVVAGLDIALDAVVDATGGGLSGGQVQRVALARAVHRLWARRLRVLLLDEPTAALDAAREGAVWRGLAALAATGVAILVTTHRPVLAVDADETPGHPFPDDGDPAHRPVAADGAVPTVTRVILLERVG